MNKEILLAQPRGFCAGVDRAIEIVERTLAQFGAPIYVRHVETVADVENLQVKTPDMLAYVTQTTLSVDDTNDVVAALKLLHSTPISSSCSSQLKYITSTQEWFTKLFRH